MPAILVQFDYSTIIFIIFIFTITLLLLSYEKAGTLIKKISIKIKNLIPICVKINNKKRRHTGIILTKTKIENSVISDMSGNINMKNVKIKDSEVKHIKGK